MRALIIESDATAASLTQQLLEAERFSSEIAQSGAAAKTLVLRNPYDLLILARKLPDMDGLLLIPALRAAEGGALIFVLTAIGGAESMIISLDSGADDYLSKPFNPDEFRARVRALVRRRNRQLKPRVSCGNLRLDRIRKWIGVDGAELRLTPKEYGVLEGLLVRCGEVVDRATLLESVWDYQFDPGTNVLDVAVTRLRRKLKSAEASVSITTHRSAGYSIEEVAPMVQ